MIAGNLVEFENSQGHLLRGVLHEPDPPVARGVCILLLSPGIKGRVGPHRLYLKLAARLVPMGFHVLRFDYHGLGDSEGELSERALADMYNSIQAGRYVGDTIAAMDWMQKTFGINRFVGSGLCGGSISALVTAESDPRIECLLGIGLPTVLEGGPENWARILTQQQIESLRGSYVRKLLDPKSWARLLSGKSDYKVIGRILRAPTLRRPKAAATNAAPAKAEVDSTNPRFASAFLSMLRSNRPMLLLFSGADRLHGQFQENFEAHHGERLARLKHLYEVHVVANANHVLADRTWVAESLQVATRWLDEHYTAP
jgi:alpha-beta hydrolase superfamily lysophospholipase